MSKQHYQVSTYKAQLSVGYLVKRAHSLMLDIMEPVIEQRGFSFIQYVVLSCSARRHRGQSEGHLHAISSRQRRAHPHHRPARRARLVGARAARSGSAQSGVAADAGRPRDD